MNLTTKPPVEEVSQKDVKDVLDLLNSTTRNPKTCISKGQLKKVAEQLLARTVMQEKQIQQLLGIQFQFGFDPQRTPEENGKIAAELGAPIHANPYVQDETAQGDGKYVKSHAWGMARFARWDELHPSDKTPEPAALEVWLDAIQQLLDNSGKKTAKLTPASYLREFKEGRTPEETFELFFVPTSK